MEDDQAHPACPDAEEANADKESTGESQHAIADDPRPALRIIRTAAAVGVLVAFAEVCWAYALPSLVAGWQAVLPATLGGLVAFYAAALATDVVVAVIISLIVWLILRGIRRVIVGVKPPARSRFLAKFLCLAGASTYLAIGWIVLYMLPPTAAGDVVYLLILAAVAVGATSLSLILLLVVAWAARRWSQRVWAAAWCAAIVVLLVVTFPAFGRFARSRHREENLPIADRNPGVNVLLITLDTLRADYLGCYGNERIKTPTLDAFAAESVLFEWAIAQAPTTTPSHCSIMTGVYPPEHDANNGRPMREGFPTIASVLSANGYETIAFTSATTTRSINSGLNRGFGDYVDSLVPWSTLFSRDEFQNLLFFYLAGLAQRSQIPGEVVTHRALHWLDTRKDRPFFVWLHYFDPHDPYDAPGAFKNMYAGSIDDDKPMSESRERYMGEISYTDEQLKHVFAALRERGLWDKTIVVIAADHGEAFGEQHWEYTEQGHGRHLYDTTQHVPLIIKPAGAATIGHRVEEQVELVDILPTVLDLLGIPPLGGIRGRSLASAMTGDHDQEIDRPAHSFNIVSAIDVDAPDSGEQYFQQGSIRTPSWKYINVPAHGQTELYDLKRDPAERFNRVDVYPDMCERNHEKLMEYIRDGEKESYSQEIAPSLVRQLRNLGYLGGAEPTEEEE